MMEVRLGKTEDYPSACELLTEFAEELLFGFGFDISPEKIQQTFDEVYQTSFVAIVDGEVVGTLAGRVAHNFCGRDEVYEEIIWFVRKEYRKYGVKLLRHVEQQCKEWGLSHISMSLTYGSQTDKLSRFYSRLGYEPMHTLFLKDLY